MQSNLIPGKGDDGTLRQKGHFSVSNKKAEGVWPQSLRTCSEKENSLNPVDTMGSNTGWLPVATDTSE